MNINPDNLPTVIYACFVLHNFCEMHKEFIHVSEEQVRTAIEHEESQPVGCDSSCSIAVRTCSQCVTGMQVAVRNRLQTLSNEVEGKWVWRVIMKYLNNLLLLNLFNDSNSKWFCAGIISHVIESALVLGTVNRILPSYGWYNQFILHCVGVSVATDGVIHWPRGSTVMASKVSVAPNTMLIPG